MTLHHQQRGVTLIELIVAIVVIAIAVLSVLGLLSSQAMHSGDAMIRSQATHIADAYLNEVIQKSFLPQANPPGRIKFNDVSDYNGLVDSGVRDQTDSPVSGLSAFTVSISVVYATLGSSGSHNDVKLITVTVTHNSGVTVMLSDYRTDHP